MDDIYSIGTFAQVHEIQDLGNRLKLVVMAHRRIKIVNQILEETNSKSEHGKTLKYFVLILFMSAIYCYTILYRFIGRYK